MNAAGVSDVLQRARPDSGLTETAFTEVLGVPRERRAGLTARQRPLAARPPDFVDRKLLTKLSVSPDGRYELLLKGSRQGPLGPSPPCLDIPRKGQ